MNSIIEDLNWRYAVDMFDPEKKVSSEDLKTLVEALRLAPSSYGLQPLKLIVIEDSTLREELLNASFQQRQVVDCSHLFVICAYNTITEEYIEQHIAMASEAQIQRAEDLHRYQSFLKRAILTMEPPDMKQWNARQAYIALGHLLHACSQLRIDSTPMEGFQKDSFDRILGLTERNLHAVVLCAVGYRSPEDEQQHWPKIRRPLDEFVEYYS